MLGLAPELLTLSFLKCPPKLSHHNPELICIGRTKIHVALSRKHNLNGNTIQIDTRLLLVSCYNGRAQAKYNVKI